MADSAGNWCLIESDPGVFSEIIRELGKTDINCWRTLYWPGHCLFCVFFLGCEGVQVEELYSLDADLFKSIE